MLGIAASVHTSLLAAGVTVTAEFYKWADCSHLTTDRHPGPSTQLLQLPCEVSPPPPPLLTHLRPVTPSCALEGEGDRWRRVKVGATTNGDHCPLVTTLQFMCPPPPRLLTAAQSPESPSCLHHLSCWRSLCLCLATELLQRKLS